MVKVEPPNQTMEVLLLEMVITQALIFVKIQLGLGTLSNLDLANNQGGNEALV